MCVKKEIMQTKVLLEWKNWPNLSNVKKIIEFLESHNLFYVAN